MNEFGTVNASRTVTVHGIFNTNMVTKDGKKMLYLIALGVKKDCPDYDAIREELNKRMSRVSIPIKRVDWLLYDDEGQAYDYSEDLFYAETFEIATGFIMGLFKNVNIRRSLEYCDFISGDNYKNDNNNFEWLGSLDDYKEIFYKNHPNEIW